MKKIIRTLSLMLTLSALPAAAIAAGVDDDLYYSPKKAAKAEKERVQASIAQQEGIDYHYSTDNISVGSSMPIQVDVDTYNRRGGSTTTVTTGTSLPEDEFSYTRRIERYHNPDIVSESGDTTLMDMYYSTPSQQDINVYVINNIDVDPWYNAWSAPAWTYSWPYYSPYYYSYPRWSFSWGLNPWFDISWGWGPSYGWGPSWSWGPAWGPSWNWGPSWGWHPGHGHYPGHHPGHNPGHYPGSWASTSPGAYRPHRPAGTSTISNGNRPGHSGSAISTGRPTTRPSANTGTGNNRPGNTQRPSTNRPASAAVSNRHQYQYDASQRPTHEQLSGGQSSISGRPSGTSRPSVGTSNSRPSVSGSTSGSSSNSRRGSSTAPSSTSSSRPSSTYRSPSSSSSGSGSSYRSSGGSSNSSRGGGYSGGSHGASGGGRRR